MDRVFTTEEAARLLGLRSRVLKDWRSKKGNKLPYCKLGRLVRYFESDILEFIEESKVMESQTDASK